jgi:hypothetical protein
MRQIFAGVLIAFLSARLYADTSTTTMPAVQDSTAPVELPDDQSTTSSQESESKGIIPPGLNYASTQTITPTSTFTEKTPYEQAKDELIKANDLWAAGHFEAASDTALGAYDDLLLVRRVPGVKRSKIREEARQAAKVYVLAGITYIQQFVKRLGGGPTAVEEGRARLGDLRDVAQNYPELNKELNKAIEQLSATPVGTPK